MSSARSFLILFLIIILLLIAGCISPKTEVKYVYITVTPTITPPAVITPEQITANIPASPHVPGGLLVWYDFEENFVTTGRVRDRSGNGIDAKRNGNIRIVPGIVGNQAIQFDGNGYIMAESNPASGRKDVTFSFWFKTENPDNNYKMASAAWWRGGPGSGWTMATHIPEFWAEDTQGVCLPDISNLDNKFLRGQWNFEVVTYDGQTIKEYTNGQLINTWQTRGVPLGAGSPMVIGGWPNVGFYYTGAIDEFIIYDHALTAQEISTLYGRHPTTQNNQVSTVHVTPSPYPTQPNTRYSPKFRWGDIIEDPYDYKYIILEGHPEVSGTYTVYKVIWCPCVRKEFLDVQYTDMTFRKVGTQNPNTICGGTQLTVLTEPEDTCYYPNRGVVL